MQIGCPILANW